VEDINMLLNTEDIPNLYQSDERVDILDKISNIAQSCKLNQEYNILNNGTNMKIILHHYNLSPL